MMLHAKSYLDLNIHSTRSACIITHDIHMPVYISYKLTYYIACPFIALYDRHTFYLHMLRTRDKLLRLIKDIDGAYDVLAELQAEGDTTGYTEESFGLRHANKFCRKQVLFQYIWTNS